ncbi:MAG: hypothetical protein QOD30_2407, partial [Actinomycetota bacterium]|nr:hypothetical protein [Actinomycetota bacterium]
ILVGRLDSGEHETSLPTTTSTLAGTTTQHSTTTGTHVATTTSLPRFELGSGALLDEAAGSYVVTTDGGELVTVIDLATGDRCINRAGVGAWIPFRTGALPDRVVIGTPSGVATVDASCNIQQIDGGADGYPAAIGRNGVWTVSGTGNVLNEHRYDGAVGHHIDLPMSSGPTVVEVGGRVVVGINGSMTLVDPATRRQRDLGPGIPATAQGNRLAYSSCHLLRCALVVLDVRTGARQTIDDERVASNSWAAAFSPDGRYIGVTAADGRAAIIDLRSEDVTWIDVAQQVIGFTGFSRWVLVTDGQRVYAVHPDGTDEHPIASAMRNSNGSAVIFVPGDY